MELIPKQQGLNNTDLTINVSSFTDNKITVRIDEYEYILELNSQEILKMMTWLVGQVKYHTQDALSIGKLGPVTFQSEPITVKDKSLETKRDVCILHNLEDYDHISPSF